MSQSVQLDMEVLQRIKFLMEYDVMKTSSENFLIEQSTDLQKLAKEKGFGPVSLSKAQELYNQGKLGNTFDPISGQAKVLASRDPAVLKANQQKYGSIDVARTDVSRMYSQISPEVKDHTLDELTIDVRNFMSNWKTATAETIATILGVGIPIVIAANGLWLTLEVRQALKGNPDYLSLVFAFLATVTAGSQSAVLKPLYSAVGSALKGKAKSIGNVLDEIYLYGKEKGIWDKIKPLLEKIKPFSDWFSKKIDEVKAWFSKNPKVDEVVEPSLWSRSKTWVSSKVNEFDTWLAKIGTRAGIKPEVSQKLGSTTRWAGVPYVIHKGGQHLSSDKFSDEQSEKFSKLTATGWKFPPPQ
jgi:hypothetical protein